MQKALPLVPSLQSNWLMMHVSMMMVSYATLIVGSLLSIFYKIDSFSFLPLLLLF
jgi:ABC-type transport system involved in cytochrome c biogenesis permease subunit